MESARITVISVGADPELVWLRNFVLQSAGLRVISTTDIDDALARIKRGECDVLLMCYSLAESVRRKLAGVLREFCSDSQVVLITNEPLERPEFEDSFVYGVEGPEALIEAINAAAEKARRAEA